MCLNGNRPDAPLVDVEEIAALMAKIVASRPFLFAKRDLRIFIFSSLADRVVVVDMDPVKGYLIFSMFDDVKCGTSFWA